MKVMLTGAELAKLQSGDFVMVHWRQEVTRCEVDRLEDQIMLWDAGVTLLIGDFKPTDSVFIGEWAIYHDEVRS